MDDQSNKAFFSEPTVLVLGAGASQPYGFPLGSGLKQLVLTMMSNTRRDELEAAGGSQDVLEEFEAGLRHSKHQTIDRLLEVKTNCRAVGAYLIAKVIAVYEQKSKNALFQNRNWYGQLFDALGLESGDSESLSKLSIVTLNYDRSLEHFLRRAAFVDFNRERSVEIHTKLRKMRVLHPHGSLGKYPEVQYGIDLSNDKFLRAAAQSIRIPGDQLDDSPDFKAAQTLIAEAVNVVFLGFGYDRRSLSRLMGESRPSRQNFYGTALGFIAADYSSLETFFRTITQAPFDLGEAGEVADVFFRKLVTTDWGRLGPVGYLTKP